MQLNYSSGSTFLPSIVNIPEMALESLKLKKTANGDNKESKQARVMYSVFVYVGLHSYKVLFKYLE